MSECNIFEYAAKNKLRFPYKGQSAVEDLYSLSVTELDRIFKTLNKELQQSDEESLLSVKKSGDMELEVKIDIIKHIVKEKMETAEKRKKAKEAKDKRQHIYDIMAKRDDAAMENASDEDLKKMLAELDELSEE